MNFEDRLLAELKTEIAARAAQGERAGRRRAFGRRRLTGGAIVGVAALTALLIPAFVGSEGAAYAVTKNADGSMTVTIKALRDADRLERDLAENGARTDITYLPQHMRCAGDLRGVQADPPPVPPVPPPRHPAKITASSDAYREMLEHDPLVWLMPVKRPNAFKIFPRRIGPGRTLVIELAESHRTRLWKLGSYLVAGPVKPCTFENDPYWN
jgi:hypothetical protein